MNIRDQNELAARGMRGGSKRNEGAWGPIECEHAAPYDITEHKPDALAIMNVLCFCFSSALNTQCVDQ